LLDLFARYRCGNAEQKRAKKKKKKGEKITFAPAKLEKDTTMHTGITTNPTPGVQTSISKRQKL
jgi:hypothetical protein